MWTPQHPGPPVFSPFKSNLQVSSIRAGTCGSNVAESSAGSVGDLGETLFYCLTQTGVWVHAFFVKEMYSL